MGCGGRSEGKWDITALVVLSPRENTDQLDQAVRNPPEGGRATAPNISVSSLIIPKDKSIECGSIKQRRQEISLEQALNSAFIP